MPGSGELRPRQASGEEGGPSSASAELAARVESALRAPVSSGAADALREVLREEQGSNLVGIIFYGSRLNRTAGSRSDWDFFVVVESYARAHSSRLHAVLNRVLPPSIYGRDVMRAGGEPARCKLSLISLADLRRYTSIAAPDSYVLGRLSKRVALVHWRDAAAREAIVGALVAAVASCAAWTLRESAAYASVEAFARAAVGFSYRCEERVEGPRRATTLFDADAAHYVETYRAALRDAERDGRVRLDAASGRVTAAHGDPRRTSHPAALGRFMRRSRRRARLRWLKNVATFQGWDEYMLDKIERHQGVRIDLGERGRRHPLLAAAWHYLRLRRQGRLSRGGPG